jgi:methyl-accepting chemotaxis protein
MNVISIRQMLSIMMLSLVTFAAGCASSGDRPAATAPLRPADRMREDIALLRNQLNNTLAANQAVVAEPISNSPAARQTFASELRATQDCMEKVRADAVQVKERAAEYITLWGGNVTNFAPDHGGLVVRASEPKQQFKVKYDQFVSTMQQVAGMLRSHIPELRQLDQRYQSAQSAAELRSLTSEATRVSAEGRKVLDLLDSALSQLDELIGMASANVRAPT